VGKYRAAQAVFRDAAEIDAKATRRWPKKAKADVFDSNAFFKQRREGKKENEQQPSWPCHAAGISAFLVLYGVSRSGSDDGGGIERRKAGGLTNALHLTGARTPAA
jgi:hypothetical protein